ncbi:MAG: hypothetical protein GY719_39155 [bacterium]|nr:hypothetical protein [bacterium]
MKTTRPPAADPTSRRAWRAREPRAWGLTVVCLLGLSCASVRPPPELFEGCRDTLQRGVFHAASLACLPELASTLEELLCATNFATHRQLNDLGFGYGTSVLGQTLGEPYGVDLCSARRWRHLHCAGSPARSVREIVKLRERAYSLLPASLLGPWQSCRDYFQADRVAGSDSRTRCHLLGSFDLTGEGETVRFVAVHSPVDPMDLGTRLTEHLEVRGADCGAERWRAGSWFWAGGARLLECQRRGRSAVSFRLVTGGGQECVARLPELTEPPWQELCATARRGGRRSTQPSRTYSLGKSFQK